jgi:hypothetical protein
LLQPPPLLPLHGWGLHYTLKVAAPQAGAALLLAAAA